MDRRPSDYVALAVWMLSVGGAALTERGPWVVALFGAAALGLIWFAAEIDAATFGAWLDYHRIDVHTPPALITGCGWLGLLLCALTVAYPAWFEKLFGLP